MKSTIANRFLALCLPLAGTCAALGFFGQASAASFTWDADGTAPTNDGGGSWNSTGGTNWFNGTTYGAWGNTTNDEAIFGVANGAAGTINVGTVNANKLTFNAPGSGNYTLTGGTITLGGASPTITTNAGVSATINSALTNTASDTIHAGSGTLTLGGTGTFTGRTLIRSIASGANNGTLQVVSGANISAAGISLSTYGTNTGLNGYYVQTGGTVTLTGQFGLGNYGNNGGNGCTTNATISGGTLTAAEVSLYKWSTSNLTVSNSGVVNATSLRIGWVDSSPTGTINLGDGTNFSGGTSIQDGGTSGILNVTAWSIQNNRNYTLNFKGGTLKASGTGASLTQSNAFANARVQDTGGIIDNNGYNISYGQIFSHGGVAAIDGGLIFKGTGTTTLSGANTYTGQTAVNAGILNLTGSLGNSAVTVATNATLSGEGSTGATGSLTFNTGSTLRIDGGTPGALTVGSASTGNVTLNGTTNLVLAGATPGLGSTTYRVLNYFGTLSGGTNFAAPAGFRATIDTATPTQVNLTVDTYGLTWNGSASGAWATGSGGDTNWTGSPDQRFYAGDAVTFADGPANRDITLGAVVQPSAVSFTNTTGNDYALTGAGGIGGTTGLAVSGTGKTTLANTNTYTGATNIAAGATVQLGNATANGSLSTSSAITLNGTLAIANSNGDQSQGTHFTGSAITGTGTIYKTGTSKLTLTAANSTLAGTTVSQGTLQLNQSSAAGASITLGDANTGNNNITLVTTTDNSTPITVSAANTGTGTVTISQATGTRTLSGLLTLNRSTTIVGGPDRTGISGKITGTVGTLTFTGNRTTLDNGTNDFTGDVVVSSGVLQINATNGAIPDASSVTVSGTVKLNTSSTNETIGGLNGGGTFQNHESVGGTPGLTMGGGDKSGIFTGSLINGSGTLSVAKTGAGTQELSGSNITYTGATTVNGGTLKLTNTSAFNSSGIALDNTNTVTLALNATSDWTLSKNVTGGASANARIEKTGAAAVTLTGTGSTFGGTAADAIKVTGGTLYVDVSLPRGTTVANSGTIGGRGTIGTTTIQTGGAIEGGRAGSGTLTTGNLTFDGNATVKGTLGASYTPIAAQTLTVNGGAGGVALNLTGAGLTNGNYYDVISYTSTNVTDASKFSSGSRAYAPYLNTGANKVQLFYDANASIYWTGANGTAWNTGDTNWKLNGSNADTQFMANDVVYFNDNPANSTVDVSSGNVNPLATTFNNTATNYTLQGSNGITSGSLTKTGTGGLTITNTNTYSGGTTLTGGTVELGSSGALGTSGAITMDGGTLRYSASNNTDYSARLLLNSGKTATIDTNGRDVTYASALATNGGTAASLVKTGTGTLTLTTNNTWSGGTTISAGTLRLDGGFNGYGAGTGVITLGDASTPAGGAGLAVYGAGWGTGPDRWVQNDIVVAATGAGAGPLVISRPTGIYAATLKGTITLANNVTFRNTSGDRLAIEGKITGTGNVTIEGNRVNFDSTANDYVGTTTIATGAQLQLNNNNVLPATSDVTVNGQLSFQSDAATALTIGSLSGSGTVNKPWGGGAPVLTVGATGADGDFSGSITSNIGLTKTGAGVQTLSGTSDYTGATLVNAGTLYVTGALGNTTVTVGADGTFGGTGTVGGNLNFAAGADLTIDLADVNGLVVAAGKTVTFAGPFGIANLIGLDDSAVVGTTYTLITGSVDFTNVINVGEENAAGFGTTGKSAYFQMGSLNLVVIPEPSAAILLGLGSLGLALRRRRA